MLCKHVDAGPPARGAPQEAAIAEELQEEKKNNDSWHLLAYPRKYDDERSRWWRGIIGRLSVSEKDWTLPMVLASIDASIDAEFILVEWSHKNGGKGYLPVPRNDPTADIDLDIHFLVCLSNCARPTRVKRFNGQLSYFKVAPDAVRSEVRPQELLLREPLTQGTMASGELCGTRYGVWHHPREPNSGVHERRTFEHDVREMLSKMQNEIREVHERLDRLVQLQEELIDSRTAPCLRSQCKKTK